MTKGYLNKLEKGFHRERAVLLDALILLAYPCITLVPNYLIKSYPLEIRLLEPLSAFCS